MLSFAPESRQNYIMSNCSRKCHESSGFGNVTESNNNRVPTVVAPMNDSKNMGLMPETFYERILLNKPYTFGVRTLKIVLVIV